MNPFAHTKKSKPELRVESTEPLNPVYRIGRSMRIQGRLKADVDVSIDGDFEGEVLLGGRRLSTGAASCVVADLTAESIVLRGRVNGNIKARGRVTLTRTAKVLGNITAPEVTLASGCTFSGRIFKRPETDH